MAINVYSPAYLESVHRDPELMRELAECLVQNGRMDPVDGLEGVLEMKPEHMAGLEAIIEPMMRPVVSIVGDTFTPPTSSVWKYRLERVRERLMPAIKAVARLELVDERFEYVGTAWMVAPYTVVTNRHVAEQFIGRNGGVFTFRVDRRGQPIRARVDFKEEHRNAQAVEVPIVEALYLADADPSAPDLAFLRLADDTDAPLPAPIPLAERKPRVDDQVAVIGYPNFDRRNDIDDVMRIFNDIFGVKRLAPGVITGVMADQTFMHDCSTLSGNSGSVVVALDTGEALGLHFAGIYQEHNLAIDATTVRTYLDRLAGGHMAVPEPEPDEEELIAPLESVEDRTGYAADFLGEDASVPLPTASEALADDVVIIDENDPNNPTELRYLHYSVVMKRSRRLALFTAVNIDGAQARRVKRGRDRWRFDPRLPRDMQLGNELYRRNPLDRGHLVRRLDPVWGEREVAEAASVDTFFWTNCSPQHSQLNQRTWLALEDHILDNAATLDFKVSVFSGPIYRDDDPLYRGLTLLPQAFWKVVVMRRTDDQTLSATGYVLSQASLISDLEFAFGEFRTFQVPITQIEEMTGLDFNDLRTHDPLAQTDDPHPSMLENLDSVQL